MTEARAAVEREPLWIQFRHGLALALYLARRYEAAMAEAHAGLELDPSSHHLYWDLGLSLACLGKHDAAVEALRHATSLAPDDLFSQAYLGWTLGVAGHRQEALTVLGDLERRRNHAYVGGVLLAWVSLGLGQNDQAITWLQTAIEERDGLMPHLNKNPLFDPLRVDPRFQALLRRMNFPETAGS